MANQIIPVNAAGKILYGNPKGDGTALPILTLTNLTFDPRTGTLASTGGGSGVQRITSTNSTISASGFPVVNLEIGNQNATNKQVWGFSISSGKVIPYSLSSLITAGIGISATPQSDGSIQISTSGSGGTSIKYGTTIPTAGSPTANVGDWYFLQSSGTGTINWKSIIALYLWDGTNWLQWNSSPTSVGQVDPTATLSGTLFSVPLYGMAWVHDGSATSRLIGMYRREAFNNLPADFVKYNLPALDTILNSGVSTWTPTPALASNKSYTGINVGTLRVINDAVNSTSLNSLAIASQTVTNLLRTFNSMLIQSETSNADLVFQVNMLNALNSISKKFRFSAQNQLSPIDPAGQDLVIDIGFNTPLIRIFGETGWYSGSTTVGKDGNTADPSVAIQLENPLNITSAKVGGTTATTNQVMAWDPTVQTNPVGAWSPKSLANLITAGANVTITPQANGTIIINATGGGGGSIASFSATPSSGSAPLTVVLTDTSNPAPTGWTWTITGGTYTISSGTLTSNTLTVVLNQAVAYTITMTPTKASTSYIPATASTTVTPTLISGDFSIGALIEPLNAKSRNAFNYTASDLIRLTFALINAQTCSSVTSYSIISSNTSTAPTIPAGTLTPAVINSGGNINSTTIPSSPSFIDASGNLGLSFTTSVTVLMNQSDGTTVTKTHSDTVSYFLPALYVQNQSGTAPTFDGTQTPLASSNYQSGQSGRITAGTLVQNLWLALPGNISSGNLPAIYVAAADAPNIYTTNLPLSSSSITVKNIPFTLVLYSISTTSYTTNSPFYVGSHP